MAEEGACDGLCCGANIEEDAGAFWDVGGAGFGYARFGGVVEVSAVLVANNGGAFGKDCAAMHPL